MVGQTVCEGNFVLEMQDLPGTLRKQHALSFFNEKAKFAGCNGRIPAYDCGPS